MAAALGLLAAAAQAQQGTACDVVKEQLAARIEATGVRGYALDIVAPGEAAPPGSKVIGTCAGGASKIMYRRWASTPGTAASVAAPTPTPAPTPVAKAPTAPAPAPTPVAVKVAEAPPPASAPAPAPAPAPAAAEPDPARAIDTAVTQLALSRFALALPDEATLGDTAPIELSLTMEDAAAASPAAAADHFEARLAGANLRITALTPEEQPAGGSGRREWRWQLQPSAVGPQTLQLTLSAAFRAGGAPVLRTVRTFDKTLRVKAAPTPVSAPAVGSAWVWLWSLPLLLFAGWFWWRRRTAYDEAGLPRGPKLHV